MLQRAPDYAWLCARFEWRIPDFYNMGVDACDRHADADPGALALIVEDESGRARRYRFLDIKRASNRLANVLKAHGMAPGDRCGVLLPQAAETAIAHIALYKSGLIAVPLFVLFGEDALEFRLQNSGARALITDRVNLPKVNAIRDRLPDLQLVLVVDGRGADGTLDYEQALERASDEFTPVRTRADDPALIIYTSGTTGQPKGALHAQRVLLGHLPGVEVSHDFFPQPGDLYWTPADWAWIGGLLDVLLPAWHHRVPVLARRFAKFDPHEAFALMRRHEVRNVFLPPTALKLMRQAGAPANHGVRLRTIMSGGETLGAPLLEWARETFGVTINELYGQTECNLVVSNCAALMPVKPGSMGRAVPGHTVAVIDDSGRELPRGEVGNIAFRRPDPVMFLEYWKNPGATAGKFIGDWLVSGDLGAQDEDGYFWYQARADDVITSGGYRIGPGEIEDCLLKHPAVAMAAAVGVPDPIRTEVVKAYIVLKEGYEGTPELARDIQQHVKTRLAAHEYPRDVEFIDAMPLTATGKVMRRELRARARQRAE
ncbi:MAG TPA: AMP-binding protein [Burkholderiales bacterium]